MNQRYDLWRNIWSKARQRRGIHRQVASKECCRSSYKRCLPCEHLVHDDTERIHIAAVHGIATAAALLWRHVRRGSHHDARLGLTHPFGVQFGDAEVEDLDALRLLTVLFSDQHNVHRL